MTHARPSRFVPASESAEVLVKHEGGEMYQRGDSVDDGFCLGIFDCLSAREAVRERKDSYAHRRASRRIGMFSTDIPLISADEYRC